MNAIIIAVAAVTIIGIVCAVLLSVASKVMAVEEDPLAEEIRECLPGANCGACGFAGCDGYAAALAQGDVKTNLCIPGGDETARKISELKGVSFEAAEKRFAVVNCCGDCDVSVKKARYEGIESCTGAKLFYGGDNSCTFGCLGLGDCASVCPSDAICIENGLARIDARLCTGCGTCVSKCPNKLITVIPDGQKVFVACSNTDKGAKTGKDCSKGCIGCKKCEKECPVQAITVINNNAVIDYSKCNSCGHCAEICTTKCIVMLK